MCLFNHTIRPPLFSTYFTWSEVHWEPYNDDDDDHGDRYDDDDYGDYDENDNDVCSDDDDDCYDDYDDMFSVTPSTWTPKRIYFPLQFLIFLFWDDDWLLILLLLWVPVLLAMAWVVSRLFGGDGDGGDNTVPKEIHYDNDDDVDHYDRGDVDDSDNDDSDDDDSDDDSDDINTIHDTPSLVEVLWRISR